MQKTDIDGVGNYVINVVNSDNKIIHTIFMMDSHSNNGNQKPEDFNKVEQGTAVEGLEGWFTNGNYTFKPSGKQEKSPFALLSQKLSPVKVNKSGFSCSTNFLTNS